MLIPGLPPAGSLNDKLKTRQDVAPTAAPEALHEALQQPVERRRRDHGRLPERRKRGKGKALTDEVIEQVVADSADERAEGVLPSKGLLVDIQA